MELSIAGDVDGEAPGEDGSRKRGRESSSPPAVTGIFILFTINCSSSVEIDERSSLLYTSWTILSLPYGLVDSHRQYGFIPRGAEPTAVTLEVNHLVACPTWTRN
jgi:hypothetical protein